MRGRASGLGARISSIDLVILGGSAEVHRADNLLDERDLASGDAIFRVEVLVRPPPCPLLGWHERVDLARCVLGWLVQKNEEASQPTGEVGQDAFSLILGVEWANAEAAEAGREFLRLDCLGDNPGIRDYYEDLGFEHRGDVVLDGRTISLYERSVR